MEQIKIIDGKIVDDGMAKEIETLNRQRNERAAQVIKLRLKLDIAVKALEDLQCLARDQYEVGGPLERDIIKALEEIRGKGA